MENALNLACILKQKYRIIDVIGHGGYGITYHVKDIKTDKEYAIKEFFPKQIVKRAENGINIELREKRFANTYRKLIKQFLFEARFLAGFAFKENIVSIYEFFEENQTAYFVMELLKGVDLRQYIKKNKVNKFSVSINRVIDIMKQILNGLREIHNANVVHCDIKPSNIFVEENGNIKIIDFGLAKKMDDINVLGMTKMYVAPEVITGDRPDSYSDVYSAGIIMYELLTLRCPPDATLRLNGVSVTEPMEYNKQISHELNNIILKAIELEPDNRFANSTEFIDAIEGKSKLKTVKHLNQNFKRIKNGIYAIFIVSVIFLLVCVILFFI